MSKRASKCHTKGFENLFLKAKGVKVILFKINPIIMDSEEF